MSFKSFNNILIIKYILYLRQWCRKYPASSLQIIRCTISNLDSGIDFPIKEKREPPVVCIGTSALHVWKPDSLRENEGVVFNSTVFQWSNRKIYYWLTFVQIDDSVISFILFFVTTVYEKVNIPLEMKKSALDWGDATTERKQSVLNCPVISMLLCRSEFGKITSQIKRDLRQENGKKMKVEQTYNISPSIWQ